MDSLFFVIWNRAGGSRITVKSAEAVEWLQEGQASDKERGIMKKLSFILVFLLCCAFFAGCSRGGRDGTEEGISQEGGVIYKDIQVETKDAFLVEAEVGKMMGMQFYKGERVMIWAVRNNGLADIYLYREDGSREMLLEGMSDTYSFGSWLLDAEEGFYFWDNLNVSLEKMDGEGKTLYSVLLKDVGVGSIHDLHQLADGRLVMVYSPPGSGSKVLSQMDPDTGKISRVSTVKLESSGRVAAGEEGLLYLDGKGVSAIDMESGGKERVLSFTGTSYLLQDDHQNSIEDFRVLDDGSVEILRYRREADGEKAFLSEVLHLAEEADQKTVLSMRCWNLTGAISGTQAWLKQQVVSFNQQSSSYIVALDECPEGTEAEDFARQTSIEMTAGRGPDLLFGDVMGDYVYGAIRKGVLADLAPYMEASGIREEDYFPSAFGAWREGSGVYGVCLSVRLDSYRMRKGVLEEGAAPDGEGLTDALLAWPEDGVLKLDWDAAKVLRYLLEGSEDFWGILDWEAGTCDFSGGIFARMLEAAKRFGNDGLTERLEILERRTADILTFDTAEDQEAEGMEAAGVLFEDGFHSAMRNTLQGYHQVMSVNANSDHVEGAWEFILFLLGKEAQTALQGSSHSTSYEIPVHRGAFEICIQNKTAIDRGMRQDVPAYNVVVGEKLITKYPRSGQDITEEKIAQYREFLEDARPLPLRTVPLLDIILEEAEYYFDGMKSVEEVSAVIQNRVQLYMDENR